MALARLISRGQRGLTAYEVTVEVHLAGGLPSFTLVGLPAAAVRESKDRVRAALQTCGMPIPSRRITAYLGPADIPKEGGRFDLALALALVQAEHALPWQCEGLEFVGELALSGALRPVRSVLPAVLAARDAGRALILPTANAAEAGLVADATAYQAAHLLEVLDHLNGIRMLQRVAAPEAADARPVSTRDLADVRGQAAAKRALLIAAAGSHHVLLVGPPGSGKSMLAERLPDLLPPPDLEQQLAIACIASVAGLDPGGLHAQTRPFRAPHHSTTAAALVGGGARPRPGEVSLAHQGVLFLDELPEFPRAALEALREPLELGAVTVSRVADRVQFPARFQLVAAMNPCPCGYWGDGSDRCRCSPGLVRQYHMRVSGPLLDRFDMRVEVPRVNLLELPASPGPRETPDARTRVHTARLRQLDARQQLNSELDGTRVWALPLASEGRTLLQRATARWALSARGATRVLRVARTIADLAETDRIGAEHIAEALQLRLPDHAARPDAQGYRL